MPKQCKNAAMAGHKFCGVHLKSLPYGDINNPKAHSGCPLYIPQKPVKAGVKYWTALKQRLAKAPPVLPAAPVVVVSSPGTPPALPAPPVAPAPPPALSDPVGLILNMILKDRCGVLLS